MAKEKATNELVIEPMKVGSTTLWIRGTSPLVFNAMSAKARQELLYPKGRKTTADKARNIKHDPHIEYVNSTYRRLGNGATRLVFPACAFKAAMCNAALEIPGAKKAQVGRLVWVEGTEVDVFGSPQLWMSVVRSADMNKTPDVRTRAILPQWACKVTIRFVMPTINATSVGMLLATAGMVIGIGDFRQEKGKGNYGQFEVVNPEDVSEFCKSAGMAEQDAALKSPEFFDSETQELITWFDDERARRGQ